MQCDAADDAQQVIPIDLARETQTATLTQKDDTCSVVNNDRVKVLSNGTEILTQAKSEGVRNDAEEDRAVGPTCKVQTGKQVDTEDQEKTAVASTNEMKILSLAKCEVVINAAEEGSAVELLTTTGEVTSNAVNHNGAEVLSSDTNIDARKERGREQRRCQ